MGMLAVGDKGQLNDGGVKTLARFRDAHAGDVVEIMGVDQHYHIRFDDGDMWHVHHEDVDPLGSPQTEPAYTAEQVEATELGGM